MFQAFIAVAATGGVAFTAWWCDFSFSLNVRLLICRMVVLIFIDVVACATRSSDFCWLLKMLCCPMKLL